MIKFKKILLGFVGACILAVIFPVFCLANVENLVAVDASSKMHAGERIQEIYSQLDLTDEQKRELEANKQQHRAQMGLARQEMKTDKEAIKNELMKPQLDMPKIKAIHERIKALQDQMEDNKLASVLGVRAILTPEQFTKFVNLMHKHKEGHED